MEKAKSPQKKDKTMSSPNKTQSNQTNQTNPTINTVTTEENQQKSEQPITNISTIKLSKNFTIPNAYGERLEYIKSLFFNEDLPFINHNAPPRDQTSMLELTKYYLREFRTVPEVLSGILFYISTNIKLDPNPPTKKTSNEQAAEEVFNKGCGTSEGICNLFKELAGIAGIKIEIIKGLLKKEGYKYGDSLYKHYWCVLNVGKYYFIDPSLMMGDINKDNVFEPNFKAFYFLTPPEMLIDSHRPEQDKWQCINKTLNVKQFAMKTLFGYESFYHNIFKYNIKLISHCYPEFLCKDSEVAIRIAIENAALNLNVEYNGKKIDNEKQSVEFDDKKNCFIAKVEFPSNGEYIINILGKLITSTDLEFIPMLKYKAKVTIVNQKKTVKKLKPLGSQARQASLGNRSISSKAKRTEKKLSKSASDFDKRMKKKCYDNKGCHLYEPKNHFLKIGQETKFKVKVKDARVVFVLDGRHWNYLKRREDEVFEGSVSIKNENVCICALKGSNVYTEIYEFFAMKR